MTTDDLEDAYRTHEPLSGGQQSAEDVAVGPEGITVLADANFTGDGEHTWLLRLDLDGAITWQRHLEPKYGAGQALVTLPDGGFAIAGSVQRGSMAFQATLVTTSASGQVVAAKVLGPPGVTGFAALHSRADGSLLAGGSSPEGWLVAIDRALRSPVEHALGARDVKSIGVQSSGNVAVLQVTEMSTSWFGRGKLSSLGPTGESLWEHEVPTTGHGDPDALMVGPDGMLAVGTGAADEHALAHVWLAMFDNAGTVRWERTITAGVENARSTAAVRLADGYAIVGDTLSTMGARTPHVWRIGKDGAPLWDRRYPPADGDKSFDSVTAIAAVQDGGFVFAGTTLRGPGRTNVWVVRLAADGTMIWQRAFGSPAPKAE